MLMLDDIDLVQLIEGLPDAVLVAATDGVVLHANPAVEPLLGYAPHELLGAPLVELIADLGSVQSGTRVERRAAHSDGRTIPVEVALVPLPGAHDALAVVIRDVALRRSLIGQLVANTELMRAMAAGAPIGEILRVATHHVRSLVDADACWVALAPAEGDALSVVARDDRLVPSDPSAAEQPPLTGFDVGPVLVVEVGHADMPGLLAATRSEGAPEFDDADRSIGHQFASAITMALDLERSRRAAAAAAASAEHARVLHDSVMQRLFAEGLMLESAAPLASSPVAERIRSAVTNLDDVIRDIRETIFEVQTHELEQVETLADERAQPASTIVQ
jgi:PAS domain S-box-containing protein